MPFTNYALDAYVSQELSKLNECSAPDLSKEFDQAEHWVNNFILNSIFRVQIKPEAKPFIFGILRRAQMALAEYGDGRAALLDYLGGSKERVSVYFRALYHFEIVVGLLYQAYEMAMKITGKQLFQKNDGSTIERLNRLYSISKHLEASTIPEGHIHAVWITNDGLVVSTATLSWQELADLAIDVGTLANSLSNPPLPAQGEDREFRGRNP